MASPIYRRVIVKISGEALAGRTGDPNGAADFGIQQAWHHRQIMAVGDIGGEKHRAE